jgi:hypothetical protein
VLATEIIFKAVGTHSVELPVPDADKRCFQTEDLSRACCSLCATHPASLHHTFRLNLAEMYKNTNLNFHRKHFNKPETCFILFLPVNITQSEAVYASSMCRYLNKMDVLHIVVPAELLWNPFKIRARLL